MTVSHVNHYIPSFYTLQKALTGHLKSMFMNSTARKTKASVCHLKFCRSRLFGFSIKANGLDIVDGKSHCRMSISLLENGPTTNLDRIVSHVLKQVIDPVTKLDAQKFSVMKSLDRPLMVLTRREDDASSSDLMDSLARQEFSNFAFVGELEANSPLLAGFATGRRPPFIMVFNARDETTPVYDGPFERDELLKFFSTVSSPLITPLQLDNIMEFMQVKDELSKFIGV